RRQRGFDRAVTNLVRVLARQSRVYVNGTASRPEARPPAPGGAVGLTVKSAGDWLAIEPSRVPVVKRLIDVHPEMEPRLRLVVRSTMRTDRVRAAQPLLAALIVAHAASVAHLVRYG